MKKYLIVTSFVFAFALLSSSFVSPVLAQGTIGGGIDDTPEPGVVGQLLTKLGNGSLGSSFLIPSFQLAPKQFSNGSLGTTPLSWFNTAKNITFRVFGTSFLNNIVAYQDTLIHRLTVGSVSSAPADAPLRVDGYIRIDSLADPSADPYVPACVNDFGRIERCSTTTPPDDPTPINGVCGPSHGGSFSEAPTEGLCLVTGSVPAVVTQGNLFKWNCTGQLGGTTAACQATKVTTSYHWDWSPWGACTGGVGSCSGEWYPANGACSPGQFVAGSKGPNGEQPGPYEGMSCISFPQESCPFPGNPWMNHPCNHWNPNYQWPANSCSGLSEAVCGVRNGCTWNVTGASQTRTAICKDNQGNQVPENLCPQPKPQAQTQSC